MSCAAEATPVSCAAESMRRRSTGSLPNADASPGSPSRFSSGSFTADRFSSHVSRPTLIVGHSRQRWKPVRLVSTTNADTPSRSPRSYSVCA